MQNIASQFLLRQDITFLNFGSFGACPKPIFEKYQSLQLQLEQQPVQFMVTDGPRLLAESRKALGTYLNCDADDVVYVTNPSYAVNILAKSLKLEAGDEILTTNLEYGACDKTWDFVCEKSGAKYIRQNITLPLVSKEQFVAEFAKGITAKTKLIFLSHFTSTTALIFPAQEIVALAKQHGIMVFIDGAHVPGHIHLDLKALDADFYTGACHKWMMTPKGSSFLYARKNVQNLLMPLVVSWGYKSAMPSSSQFIDYHQLQGTRDFTGMCCIPAAIEFMQANDWWQKSEACKQLVLQQAPRFAELLNTKPLAPLSTEFIGQMLSLPIKCANPMALKNKIYQDYKIEIPVMPHGHEVYLRFSIGAFNTVQDLDVLYEALKDLIAKGEIVI
jgi:isopenicillin-N epimerase